MKVVHYIKKNKQKFFLSIVSFFVFALPVFFANAQLLSYGGRQIMFWGEEVCDNSDTNVHFVLDGENMLTLYNSPTTILYGGDDVDFGTSQVGQYNLVPVECVANIAGNPVVIWITDGTYYSASTSVVQRNQFFAGAMNPFIWRINTKA